MSQGKTIESSRKKLFFVFSSILYLNFGPKTIPFFFLSESSKCLNYFVCQIFVLKISLKKSAKTIGNSCFCLINHLLAVWKSVMMDNTHDQVKKKKKKIKDIKNLISFQKHFIFFENLWDLVELCVCVMSDAVCNLFPLFPEKKMILILEVAHAGPVFTQIGS